MYKWIVIIYWSKLPTQHFEQCVLSHFFFKQFIPNSAYVYTIKSVIQWHQLIKSTPKMVLVNSTEGTLVAKSISWNVRKASIRCDQRVQLWQINNEYTIHTLLYLLIRFRHLFIIMIRILKHYILIQLSPHAVLCKMTVDVISVQYLLITYRESPNNVYLSNVASGLDAYSSFYIFGDISPKILIW